MFHSWKMNKFYEPVQQNDFKVQLTNPGKLTYMDVRELTYMNRRRSDVPLLTNTRSKVKFQEPVHENELNTDTRPAREQFEKKRWTSDPAKCVC